MQTNLSMKTGKFSNLSKAIEIIAKSGGKILREDLFKHFAGRSAQDVIQNLIYGVPGSNGALVDIEKQGRKKCFNSQ